MNHRWKQADSNVLDFSIRRGCLAANTVTIDIWSTPYCILNDTLESPFNCDPRVWFRSCHGSSMAQSNGHTHPIPIPIAFAITIRDLMNYSRLPEMDASRRTSHVNICQSTDVGIDEICRSRQGFVRN